MTKPTVTSSGTRAERHPEAAGDAPSVAIVIPTIRDLSFLEEWREEFAPHKIIVCEDHPTREVALPPGFDIDHYSWAEIDAELGDASWIVPRQNAAIRNFGYWKAWSSGIDIVVTIDDDCYPAAPSYIASHVANLTARVTLGWEQVCDFPTRGFPYGIRASSDVVVSHGLWEHVPDLDAPTQLTQPHLSIVRPVTTKLIGRGSYFPMSGMNLAFRASFAPAMWFPLMGRGWPFDRFDDIWAGVLAKRVADHLGFGMISGDPTVEHRRASNVFANLRKEAAGIEANETFWRAVDSVALDADATTVAGAYLQLSERLPLDGPYFEKLRTGMAVWASLFT